MISNHNGKESPQEIKNHNPSGYKRIALTGNPNCGKTTLFNSLTGSRQKTGNWAGVTVEKKTGNFSYENITFDVVDLPGSYSLDVGMGDISLDEKIARDYILLRQADLIVNVIDAANIERNLYLTTQIMEMRCPMIVVLNMMDVAQKKGLVIDIETLSHRLGCPVVPVVASDTAHPGIHLLKETAGKATKALASLPASLTFSDEVEKQITNLKPVLEKTAQLANMDLRWLAIKLLEGDPPLEALLDRKTYNQVTSFRTTLESVKHEDVDIIMAEERYNFINQLASVVIKRKRNLKNSLTSKIDSVVLNPVLGIPVFLAVMYCMFTFAIKIGQVFQDVVQQLFEVVLVSGMGHFLALVNSPGWLITAVTGAGEGIATVANFIPLIAALFLFLSVLEDSGYMARAAFVVDRLMKKIGLPGKSFVPLIVGFGCNVPAIMATRTLQRERDRKLSIMMNPFMSCGARLQVFSLLAMVFFESGGQNVVFSLYLLGIIVAIFTGLVMKKTLLKGETSPFILELPVYHLPTFRVTFTRTWERLKGFVVRAGKTIVLLVMVITVLNTIGKDGSLGNDNTENSLLASVSKTISPVFKPMGITEDNWPATVGIFTGVLAKETVAGTLSAVYGQIQEKQNQEKIDTTDQADFHLMTQIKAAIATVPDNFKFWFGSLDSPFKSGNIDKVNSPVKHLMHTLFGGIEAVLAYMIFVLLYMPCVAAMGAVRREAGIGWMIFSSVWTTFLAYSIAVIFYQTATFWHHPVYSGAWIVSLILSFAAFIALLRYLGNRVDQRQESESGSAITGESLYAP